MKIISAYTLLLLVCLVAVTASVHGQANDTAAVSRGRWTIEGRANKITDKISHKLNLNRAQTEKIYVINEDIVRRMDAVKKNASLSKKERMTQFKALDSERSQRFKTVFTAAQYKKWNDWEMNKKEHLEARMEKKRQKKELKNGQ